MHARETKSEIGREVVPALQFGVLIIRYFACTTAPGAGAAATAAPLWYSKQKEKIKLGKSDC